MQSNMIQVFESTEFGKLEVLMINGKPYFPAKECAETLGYAKLIYAGVDFMPFAPFSIPFSMPWLLIAACSAGVFAITFIIMRVSAASLKKGSIIEEIRGVQ